MGKISTFSPGDTIKIHGAGTALTYEQLISIIANSGGDTKKAGPVKGEPDPAKSPPTRRFAKKRASKGS